MAKRYVLGAHAAREINRLIHGTGVVSSRKGIDNALALDGDAPLPFTVKWAQSVNDGDGSWIVWLPSDSCLIVNGEAVDLTSGLTEAGGDYPAGWYCVDCLDETTGGSLFLNVTIRDSQSEGSAEASEVTATFANAEAEADDGETVYPVLIASCDGRDVSQTVCSAIVIGSGAQGDVVTSLNDETGDMDVIGGTHIVVETIGKTIKVSYDDEKEEEDDDPNNDDDPCEHPGSGGHTVGQNMGDDGAGGVIGGGSEGGIGEGCCGGGSTVGSDTGSGAGTSGTGSGVAAGSSGKSGTGTSANGKEATSAPSGGESAGGSQAAGGLFAGSTTGRGSIASITAHGNLSTGKTMNQSPFVKSGQATTIEQTQGATAAPIYGGTHAQLTSANTMTQSPFKN